MIDQATMTGEPSFSQRLGKTPIKSMLQIDSMDSDLRNGLWNVLTLFLWNTLDRRIETHYRSYRDCGDVFFETLWMHFLKQPIDGAHPDWQQNLKSLRKDFFAWDWLRVYDFVEFTARHFPVDTTAFKTACNALLERELSGYRFIGNHLVPITSPEEIASVAKAIAASDAFTPVSLHIEAALRLLADRKSPDYRNSIKESISAVESLCKLIAEDDKATLGAALKKVESKYGLHGSLKAAFSSLYGYTSDADGIRHALLTESQLDFDDAKFMLVSCSAFVNYLISKAAKKAK